MDCDQEAFVTESLQKIGFANNVESSCSMWTAKRGDIDVKKNDDGTIQHCIDGPGEFDMDGSLDDQVSVFKSVKAYKVADSTLFPFEGDGTGKFRY